MGLFRDVVESVLGEYGSSSYSIDEEHRSVEVGFTSRRGRKNAWYAMLHYNDEGDMIGCNAGMPGTIAHVLLGRQIERALKEQLKK